jgi:hypothetical protein
MRSALILAATVALALVACGGGGGEAASAPTPAPTGGSEPAAAAGDTITGTLGGDAELEGGCAWIDDGKTRWQVQYPQGYEVAFDPLTLTGPNGETAAEGDTLTITGSEQTDAMTLCQVGPLWLATSVEFAD